MKKTKALLVFLLLSATLQAQQYVIQYDMATEDLRYLKIKRPGDTVSSAIIDMNKAKRVNLQLMNTAGSYRQQIVLHEKAEAAETVVIPGLGSASSPEGLTSLIGNAEKTMNADNLLRGLLKTGEN